METQQQERNDTYVQEQPKVPNCRSLAGDGFPEPRGWSMDWAADGLYTPAAPRALIIDGIACADD